MIDLTTAEITPMTLDSLKVIGTRALIADVAGEDAIAVRLMEMGLTDGEEIELVGFAPLGDPIEYRVRGYRVSLRAAEAARVRVETIPATEVAPRPDGRG